MPFDSSRAGFPPLRRPLLAERLALRLGEAGARGFSLGSLSIAIVAALVLGGAMTLFALGSLRASGEALRAVALAAAVREAAAHSRGAEARSLIAEEACAESDGAATDCSGRPPPWSRAGPVRLHLDAVSVEDGILRLRWRAEHGGRRVRAELVIAGNPRR